MRSVRTVLHRLLNLYSLLDQRTRRRLPVSAALALIVALSEAAGIGLIFPLLLAVADPERLQASAGLQRIYNLLGARSAEDFVTRAGGLIVSLLILKNLFALAIVRWQVSFLSQQECALSVSLFRRYLTMPYEAFSRRNSPELIQMAAGETSTAISAFMLPAVSLLVELAVIAGIVAVVVVIDPSAAIAILATIVCAAAAFNASMRMWLRRLGERLIFSNTEVLRRLQEGIGAAKEIRVLGRSAAIEAEFLKSRRKLANLRATHTFFGSLPRAYLEIVLLLSLVAVAWFTMRDRPIAETVSVLAIFGAAGLRLLPSVNRVLVLLQQMNVAGPSVDQLYRELSGAGSNAPAPTGPPLAVGIGEALPDRDPPTRQRGLVISGVHYRYVDRPTPALSGVSLQVPWGRSIGLVGVSGAGKSTLVDIILGLRQPQRGSVLVDGREICSNIDAWQRRIGYVPQQIFLIDASIRRNIALGIPDDGIDERRIHEVMQIASIDELVAGLPDGLDTIVGEEGASLSGGQRQRIGIARALYHDPDVLLLDEATSALDNATESKITEMLGRLAGIKTMIVVAHRLSTIRRCDSIAVLKDGVCVGQGPYDELACTNLDFADLIRAGSR